MSQVVFDFTLPVFMIVCGTTGGGLLKRHGQVFRLSRQAGFVPSAIYKCTRSGRLDAIIFAYFH